MATATEIITTFELLVNDITELSTSEELALLNRIYFKICRSRPWEALKTGVSGTMSGSGIDGFYITIPSDFSFFSPNYQYTDNTISSQQNSVPAVIFVGSSYTPYKIVNFSDRRQYLGQTGYAYLDLANNRIVMCGTPISTSYSFDYIKVPSILVANSTPALIPTDMQDMIAFGMAADNDILQLSPKATAYREENQGKYESYMLDLSYWNANLILN